MITLPTDRYYRGYRLSITKAGVIIYHGPDRICGAVDENQAKDYIDGWMIADDAR